jgi:hypothetical protein
MATTGENTADKYVTVNKYVLYAVVLVLVFGIGLSTRLYALLIYRRTEGVVAGYHDQWVHTKTGGYNKHFPLIRFKTKTHVVTFAAPSYMYEESRDKVSYPVIYDADEPTNAYVFTFMGFLGTPSLYLGPFFLIWTIFLLGYGFLPKRIRFRREYFFWLPKK